MECKKMFGGSCANGVKAVKVSCGDQTPPPPSPAVIGAAVGGGVVGFILLLFILKKIDDKKKAAKPPEFTDKPKTPSTIAAV